MIAEDDLVGLELFSLVQELGTHQLNTNKRAFLELRPTAVSLSSSADGGRWILESKTDRNHIKARKKLALGIQHLAKVLKVRTGVVGLAGQRCLKLHEFVEAGR